MREPVRWSVCTLGAFWPSLMDRGPSLSTWERAGATGVASGGPVAEARRGRGGAGGGDKSSAFGAGGARGLAAGGEARVRGQEAAAGLRPHVGRRDGAGSGHARLPGGHGCVRRSGRHARARAHVSISTHRAGVGLQCVYSVGPAYGSQNAHERVVHSSIEPLLCVLPDLCSRHPAGVRARGIVPAGPPAGLPKAKP